MCTAVNYKSNCHFFGRTLDLSHSYGESVFITPRKYELKLRHRKEAIPCHYAIIGMAACKEGFPLYFDAINEVGVAMAGLNFPYNSTYFSPNVKREKTNIASFELIPYILSLCDSTDRAQGLIENMIIADTPFDKTTPPSPLHFIISDKKKSITVEQTEN